MRTAYFVSSAMLRMFSLLIMFCRCVVMVLTLIDRYAAKQFARLKFAYVGIDLDSIAPDIHDTLRGVKGAFERTMHGLRHCTQAGQKVGLRLALADHTCRDLAGVFEFFETANIKRACFYHLCPIGRGRKLITGRSPI